MITKAQRAQRDHKVSTKATPFPTIPNQLIKRGSQSACTRKLSYHDSCTLGKSCTLYQRVVISSQAKRLEKPPFAILTLPFVYGLEITICHYKGLLQEYVMLCYGLRSKGPACSAKDSPAKAPLSPCGSGISQSMSQSMTQRVLQIITQLSKTHTYSIPN
jgi:hypothetical protein